MKETDSGYQNDTAQECPKYPAKNFFPNDKISLWNGKKWIKIVLKKFQILSATNLTLFFNNFMFSR